MDADIRQLCATCNPRLLLQPVVREISVSAPRMASAGGSHTLLWTVERVVSVGLLAVIPAAFIAPSQVLDALLAISVVIHAHW